MRTVTIGNRDIEVRSLTRREIKNLKDQGYTYIGCRPNPNNPEGVVDDALVLILDEDTNKYLDTRPMADTIKVWRGILDETYSNRDEEKNSQSTSGGTQTESEPSTAKPVVPEQ
jgi:hypothetical protein